MRKIKATNNDGSAESKKEPGIFINGIVDYLL